MTNGFAGSSSHTCHQIDTVLIVVNCNKELHGIIPYVMVMCLLCSALRQAMTPWQAVLGPRASVQVEPLVDLLIQLHIIRVQHEAAIGNSSGS